MKYTNKVLNLKEKNSDIYRRSTVVSDNVDYYLEHDLYHIQSPEDLLLAEEDSLLANEQFEGSPFQSNILGFQTPHTSEEVITIFSREKILKEERMLFGCIGVHSEITTGEKKYKRLVKKRLAKIEELHPRMMNLYKINKPKKK